MLTPTCNLVEALLRVAKSVKTGEAVLLVKEWIQAGLSQLLCIAHSTVPYKVLELASILLFPVSLAAEYAFDEVLELLLKGLLLSEERVDKVRMVHLLSTVLNLQKLISTPVLV